MRFLGASVIRFILVKSSSGVKDLGQFDHAFFRCKIRRMSKERQTLNTDSVIADRFRFQQSKFDCGQTVLDILGYKGHEMFPKIVVPLGFFRMLGLEVSDVQSDDECVDYETPKVMFISGKG